jgi:hypothetical protein
LQESRIEVLRAVTEQVEAHHQYDSVERKAPIGAQRVDQFWLGYLLRFGKSRRLRHMRADEQHDVDTIARGVENGMLGYVGKKADGGYAPFHWNSPLSFQDVEISDDVYIVQREVAEAFSAGSIIPAPAVVGGPPVSGGHSPSLLPGAGGGLAEPVSKPFISESVPRLVWSGDIPHQKWMNFYTKVLFKFAATAGLKLTLRVEVAPIEGISPQKVDETKVALRCKPSPRRG